uniref:Uncharacterized protein n=1 Tax=Rhizophagus irregularis (strain DAOM 181602 / DAOM 197198 / MUCL 43194) TaxID=747089 RepID=U9TJM2_RHIID
MTKVLWGIDKQKAEEINIDQLFGPDTTKEQRELAWELGHNKILHLLEQEKWYKFTQKVAMTDCDHKERKALIEVWPDIHLILCLFHVSQSWEDKLKAVLGHHGGHEIMAFRKHLERRYTNF